MHRTNMIQFPEENGIPEEYRLSRPISQTEYLVNGELRTWDGPFKDIVSPICIRSSEGCSRASLGQVPSLTPEAALEAMGAAVRAYDDGQGLWPTMSVADRIRHVEEFVFQMKEKKEDVVKLIMWEIAKPLPDARKEFDRTIDYIQDTIAALKDLDRASSRFVINEGIIAQIRRAPLGVVLCMGPYNYPLNETYTLLIPALIMGNTVVFKPPKLGVLLYQPLLNAFRESFPPGVVNTVYGDGSTIIGPMMTSGKINVLGFIGSYSVADRLKKQHPKPHRLRSCLGMGAKNPAIVLPDADLDITVAECVKGSLSFNGQRCTAIKIIFVHRSVADDFLDRFSRAVSSLPAGMPWDEGIRITPLPVEGKTGYLSGLVQEAEEHGGRVVNEGGGLSSETYFAPAVVYPVNDKMALYSEEQFGPVVPVVPFDDISEPIRWVHESNFGQQVSLFGTEPDILAELIDPLVNQVCRVNINSQCQRGPDIYPFTGRKDSAEGTLSVSDALRVFSIRTLVAAQENPVNKGILTNIVRHHKSNFLSTDFIF